MVTRFPASLVRRREGASLPRRYRIGGSYVISANIDERFTNFGASGTLLYALVTGLLFVAMFRRTEGSR